MLPSGKQACLERTTHAHTFFTLELFDPNGQMRQLHKTKPKKKKKPSDSFWLPESCMRLMEPASHHLLPTSILSAGSYIKLTQQSVKRRLFHLPEVGQRKRWESGITMAAGVGPGQQWLTAGFRPCDEVRPLCLTPLPPALPSLLPSQQCAPWSPLPKLMDNGVGIEGGSIDICCFDTDPCWPSLSRATPIISFSPDSCWPLNLLLSYSRHPPKSIVLLPLPLWSCMHLVDLHSYPPTAEIPGKPESLNLSPPFPLLRWANKQKKQRGQSSSNIFLAMGNFLYLKRWNWTLRGRVPDHWRALKRGRI